VTIENWVYVWEGILKENFTVNVEPSAPHGFWRLPETQREWTDQTSYLSRVNVNGRNWNSMGPKAIERCLACERGSGTGGFCQGKIEHQG